MFNDPFGRFFGQPPGCGPQARPREEIPEAQKVLHGLLADLPEEVQPQIDKVEREVAKIKQEAETEVARIREQAENKAAEVENKADDRCKALLEHAVEQLEPLQKDLFRAGELGKALATFVQIQVLKSRAVNVLPDPGNMLGHAIVGKSFVFRVTGSNDGPVWGSDIYTADSHLATAAVHAGAVELGEEGLIRVRVVDMSGVQVRGSLQNVVSSMDWGYYPVGYRVTKT
jgi:hypothetical protein